MKINGIEKKIPEQISLKELLLREGFEITRIAVELNGEIVPKQTYNTVFVTEMDKLEVVSFVGGG